MRWSRCSYPLLAAVVVTAASAPAAAVSTQVWVRAGDLLRAGTSEGMVVTPDGLLAPGPRAQVWARPDAGVLWTILAAGQDVLVGGGDKVGLLRISASTTTAIAGLAGGPEVFALARGANGEVFAATSPDGAVYQVDLNTNQAKQRFKVNAKYIWALLPTPDGGLVVATGLPGNVLRFDGKTGVATQLWEAKDDHVRSLALGTNGKVLAGTAPSGQLVELDGKGGAFVLWDSERPETVSIAVDPRGAIWAAFAGAPGRPEATSLGAPKPPPRSAGTTSVTVRARAVDQQEAQAETQQPQQKKEDEAGQPPRAAELPGNGGTLVRLAVGEEPETVWSDDKETPLALLPRAEGGVLLGVGNPARLWWFNSGGRLGFFDERKENRAVSALALDGERVLAATSNPASIVVYGPEPAAPARWTSDVSDMKVRSTIGHVHAFTEKQNAGAVAVFVRAGNTAEPGPGWTDWQEAPHAAGPPEIDGGRAEGLPLARFFQVRVEARAPRPYAFGVNRVAVRHRPVNRPPRIESIEAFPQGVAFRSMPPAPMSSGEVPVIAPPRTPELDRALGESVPPWRSKRAFEPAALTIAWEAKDPDGDGLLFKLEYTRDDGAMQPKWTLLGEDLDQNFFSFDSRTLPDGVYLFRVTASDADDNAAGQGRTADRVSEPIAVDNTTPLIDQAQYARRPDGTIEVRVTGRDPGGRLAKAEVARASGVFVTLAAEDGVGDAAQETFVGVLPAPEKGQEVLVRLIDGAGNTATRRAEPK